MSAPTTYRQWAEYHALAFGLLGDRDAQMVLGWAQRFERQAIFSVAELVAATDGMWNMPLPLGRFDHTAHLAAFKQLLSVTFQKRQEQERRRKENDHAAALDLIDRLKMNELLAKLRNFGQLPKELSNGENPCPSPPNNWPGRC